MLKYVHDKFTLHVEEVNFTSSNSNERCNIRTPEIVHKKKIKREIVVIMEILNVYMCV